MALFTGCAIWLFFLFALGSFHSTDWPSHSVYPYPPIQNLCGSVGSFVAYWCFLAIGQGVFPMLFFTGVCLALLIYQTHLTDIWLRIAGLLILSVAFAAVVHHFKPGSNSGFPEGHGGVIGIAAASYLQNHFSTIGTRLVLATAIFLGLLLAADDLVLRVPGLTAQACGAVTSKKHWKMFSFPALPKLPSLPKFVTRDAVILKPPAKKREPKKPKVDEDDEPVKGEVVLKIDKNKSEEDEEKKTAKEETTAIVVAPPPPGRDIIVKLPSMIKPRQNRPATPPKELGEYQLAGMGLPGRGRAWIRREPGEIRPREGGRSRAGAARVQHRCPGRRDRHRPGHHDVRNWHWRRASRCRRSPRCPTTSCAR